jgi:tetratricopeptide (TPR) repeat protein
VARRWRILHVESPNPGKQGDHVYRTRQPCQALGERPGVTVASGSLLAPAVQRRLGTADVLVLCDVVDPDLLPVLEARRAAGKLTVYEINDHFLAPQPWNQTAYLSRNLVMRSLSSQLAARSNAIQFCTPELEREFGRLGDRRAVFENNLWAVPPLLERAGERLWVGWGGSVGHREDLRWVWPALLAALDRHPRLGLSLMASPELRPLLAGVPAGRLRFTPGGSLESYYQFLAGVDIGVCPLLPTDFNRCRSDVKFVELAAAGAVAVCSDLAPYRDSVREGDNGLFFRTPEELGTVLDRLVSDAGLRRRLTGAAHAYVSGERIERAHIGRRLARYETWYTPRPDEPPEWESEGHHPLDGGEGELALRQGLERARDGRPEEALAEYRRAAALLPSFVLPWLYLGTDDPAPERALEALDRAAALAPASLSVSYVRGCRLEDLGRRSEAREAFERARLLCPTFGAADGRLAGLAEEEGHGDQACSLYEKALAANPYYAAPALRLATRALEAGDLRRATNLLEPAVARDPSLWSLHFLLGRAYAEAQRWPEARVHLMRALPDATDPGPVLVPLARVELALGNVAAARAILTELRRRPAA